MLHRKTHELGVLLEGEPEPGSGFELSCRIFKRATKSESESKRARLRILETRLL